MSQGRRYEVLDVVGRGGFGTVYRARMHGEGGFSKIVALKVLNSDVDGISDVARRLRDEGRLLGLINHRAIVQADALVELDGRWTVVMEYVDGVDLRALIERGPLPPCPALEIVAETAGALHAAYTAQGADGAPLSIQHRDIKPANICVTRHGGVKVLDFGIARADFDSREAHTQSLAFGSLDYMAPERFEFVCLPEGDLYSLGATFYELLAGQRFGRATPRADRHARRIDAAMGRLAEQNPAVSDDVKVLLREMLACATEDRPTAREVERRCLELMRSAEGPLLRDWAETHVGPLLEARKVDPNALAGNMLVEPGGSDVISGDPAHSGSTISTMREETPAVVTSRLPVLLVALLTMIVVVGGFGVLLAVLIYLGAVSWEEADEAEPVASPVPAAAPEPASEPVVATPEEAEPAVEPEPAVEAEAEEPAAEPAPPEPARTSAPARATRYGTVKVTGDASSVRLVRGGRSHSPGRLPTGRYSIVATFPDREPLTAGEVEVREGAVVTLACSAVFTRCTAQ